MPATARRSPRPLLVLKGSAITRIRNHRPFPLIALFTLILMLTGALPAAAARPDSSANAPRVVFEDSFDDNRNRWGLPDDATATAQIHDGHYAIDHKRQNNSWISLTFVSVQGEQYREIEARLRRTGGADSHGFGLVFNFRDFTDYDYFVITATGLFKYGSPAGGEARAVIPWTWNEAIHTGNASNVLTVREFPGSRELFINGKKVAVVETSATLKPRLGFIVFSRQNIEIDHLVVKYR